MSWDGYREYMAQKGVERCAFFGRNDGCPWFQTPLRYNPDDVKKVKEILEKDDEEYVCQNGITMDDAKWAVVKFDKEQKSIVLRGKENHKNKSMCCCMTNQCLIVGTSECDKRAPEISAPVEEMQQYMQCQGY